MGCLPGLRDFVEVQKTRAMFLCNVDEVRKQFVEVINVISTIGLSGTRNGFCEQPGLALSITFVK
jgi:hypothetical protein